MHLIDTNGNYYEAEHNITGATEVTQRPSPFHLWVDGVWVENTEEAIADLKRTKYREIVMDRDFASEAHVSAHGRLWQADKTSQELLNAAINLANNGVPLPSVWRDADNENMVITSIVDLVTIASAIAAKVQTAYSISWARKALLEAATTITEVEGI